AQRALVSRFRQEVCQGDVHAWCRGYDYTLGLDAEQLAVEMETLELATMDLGQSSTRGSGARHQPHADHVFYHGEEEEERRRAERHRQRILREQQQRLAGGGRPVYGSDGALVGFSQAAAPVMTPQKQQHRAKVSTSASQKVAVVDASKRHQRHRIDGHKQLGQRLTQARRAQTVILQAAWLLAQLLGERATSRLCQQVQSQVPAAADIGEMRNECLPSGSETEQLQKQLSVLVEYMPAETGRMFLPLVGADYVAADREQSG
ncbi:hypothetical protein GGH99_008165, partial [Coemansia sp. RSA 1285]